MLLSISRYFTWDTAKFPNPAEMQSKLATKGRKMVTIIDPHIKRDGNYHIHKVGRQTAEMISN